MPIPQPGAGREIGEGEMVKVPDTGSVRSLEELLASFAYKGDNSTRGRRPYITGARAGADGKRGGSGGAITAAATTAKVEELRCLSPPNTPPPPPQHNSRRRSSSKGGKMVSKKRTPSDPSCSSSYIRATVGGETVVVSKYFPLPSTASDPVVVDKKEILRAGKQRTRRRTASNGESTVVTRKRRMRIEQQNRAAEVRLGNGVQEQPHEVLVLEEDDDGDDGLKQQQMKKRRKMSQRTQLSAEEKKSDAYRRVGTNNTWEPPPSCHNLLQERHSFDPWRVLIICMLLNITSGRQVRRVLPGLFLLCPSAEAASEVPEEEIEKVIQTLGLQRKRARMIKQFSREYLGDEWTHVTQLHGIGKYAADAYAIFCVGKPEEVIPEDHKLIDYWKFVCGKKDTEDMVIVLN